jgi:hypothetical protein
VNLGILPPGAKTFDFSYYNKHSTNIQQTLVPSYVGTCINSTVAQAYIDYRDPFRWPCISLRCKINRFRSRINSKPYTSPEQRKIGNLSSQNKQY